MTCTKFFHIPKIENSEMSPADRPKVPVFKGEGENPYAEFG
jgi:hypothetical protein